MLNLVHGAIISGVDLHALRALSMEALKDSLDAQEMVATLVTEQPSEGVSPDHLGRNIDLVLESICLFLLPTELLYCEHSFGYGFVILLNHEYSSNSS